MSILATRRKVCRQSCFWLKQCHDNDQLNFVTLPYKLSDRILVTNYIKPEVLNDR
jgi:hypothetical protein